MNSIFIGLGIFAICMIVIALMLLYNGDGSSGQKLMQYFLIASLVQNVGCLLELTAPGMEAAIVAVKVQYIGAITIPICYCYFMFSYCFRKTPTKILHFLKIADVIIFGLVFTCDAHNIYYRQTKWLVTEDGHGYLSLEYGPGYWAFLLCGTAVPYALSIYALTRACIRNPEYAAERKYKLILVLSFLPVVALGSYALKLTYIYDPTPFTLGVILSVVVILIWSRKVYDFSGLAAGILLNSMGDGVIALDEQRRIVSYNSAAVGIFSQLGSHLIGRDIVKLEGFPQGMLDDEERKEFSLNGFYYQGHVEQIPDRSGRLRGYVVLILDVTDTRNYIEEIKRVREQAEQANIAKSAFLANMSHEIRTPMNAIVGLSDVIMEQSRGRKVYGYACDIKSSSRNLLTLINDILDLSKVEAGKMELVLAEYHVKTLVNEVLNMMDVVASQHGLLIKSEFDMTIPCRYLGDGGRIKQILINLINNALKFTKEGQVKISVAGVQGEAEDLECLSFQIEDTGCGIRQDDLESIFENFRQVDAKRNRSVEGTGLGLSITKRFIGLMGGTIDVESVYGEGTVFTVKIPQKIVDRRPLSEVPEEPVQKEHKLEPFIAKGYRVLVVDDNVVNRRVARTLLQSYDFDIDEAESGEGAIQLVRGKLYDIIFMDHMMPQMDGIEAVQIIRKDCGENGSLPVIIALTANAMGNIRETFLNNGFQDFIAKPLDRRMLHKTLQRWIPEEKRKPSGSWGGSGQDDGSHTQYKDIFIEGIDTDELAEHYSGSMEEYKSLLDLYCLDGKRKLKLLRELLERGDYQTYGIEVHALKSASANVGAMKISEIAREQERAVKRGDETFVDSHAEQLLAGYEEQIGHIKDFLAESGRTDEKTQESGNEIETAELVRELREALESLEHFRAKKCAGKVDDILQYRLSDNVKRKLVEIKEQLKLYEDDAAEQLLRDLIEEIEKEES
ncbi:MAG: response regulator [Lachnospiraceae bacterium]|nr:response regulator [Lachnospiraceae bacterium]